MSSKRRARGGQRVTIETLGRGQPGKYVGLVVAFVPANSDPFAEVPRGTRVGQVIGRRYSRNDRYLVKIIRRNGKGDLMRPHFRLPRAGWVEACLGIY